MFTEPLNAAVINVDKNPSYPPVVEVLKSEGTLRRRCRLRPVQYLKKLFALVLIVLLGCLFPHLFLALVLLAALGWVAFDMFMVWALHIGLEDYPERKRRLEERECQVPAADRFQAWLDSNQRRYTK